MAILADASSSQSRRTGRTRQPPLRAATRSRPSRRTIAVVSTSRGFARRWHRTWQPSWSPIPTPAGCSKPTIREIADAAHAVGAFFYCDGANFNAIVGRVRPGDLGIDCMHINLHKTFSTPHGGGGPGSGPVVLSAALAPYAPVAFVIEDDGGLSARWSIRCMLPGKPVGRVKGFHGQFGMFVRALAYMMSMGADGLRQASADAVLNANYMLAELKDTLSAPFPGPCMHEALFDDRFLKDTGVSTLDFAKALIDEGFHPMTVYFPLVVHGAMLVEPTETESKETLDQFVRDAEGARRTSPSGDAAFFHEAPTHGAAAASRRDPRGPQAGASLATAGA